MGKLHYDGPVVLAILDGVGLAPAGPGNAVAGARLNFLNRAAQDYLCLSLQASGEAVGVLPGQMGNSEVGHNALGSGQIIRQQVAQIEYAFQTGEIWQSEAWQKIMTQVLGDVAGAEDAVQTSGRTLHFAGIFSDGGVHSDIRHLEKMIERAYHEGVRRVRLHCVFDGRDVPPQSEPKFIERIERFMVTFPEADFKIADGVGRMVATADRYENNWGMVKKGWDLMVRGESTRRFATAQAAVQVLREQDPAVQDQYLPDFVIVDDNGHPIGPVRQGDAFIYYDFRADRAIEIAQVARWIFIEIHIDCETRTNVGKAIVVRRSQECWNIILGSCKSGEIIVSTHSSKCIGICSATGSLIKALGKGLVGSIVCN